MDSILKNISPSRYSAYTYITQNIAKLSPSFKFNLRLSQPYFHLIHLISGGRSYISGGRSYISGGRSWESFFRQWHTLVQFKIYSWSTKQFKIYLNDSQIWSCFFLEQFVKRTKKIKPAPDKQYISLEWGQTFFF